ncbi:MAG: TrmH family RNA methyltransferase [Rhizobiaceae bacterium]
MSSGTDKLASPGRVKEVTSLANPIVKDIRALFQKKHRDRQRVFIAEGLKLIVDALDQGWTIRTLVHAKTAGDNVSQTAARTVASGGDVLIVPEKTLGAITRRDNPQMAIGVFGQRYQSLDEIKSAAGNVWVALDRVRDPGNLGTIIRTADAVGASGIILIGDCTDPFSPETVRATMGSVFSVPVARCGEAEFTAWARRASVRLVGTHLEGAVDYREPVYGDGPIVLLMGNEQQGLTDELAGACETLVRIPQAGRADSLNLAVSCGVMLYEIRRDKLTLAGENPA